MNDELTIQINKIINKSNSLAGVGCPCPLTLNPNPNEKSAVIANQDKNRAVIIGTIEVTSTLNGNKPFGLKDFCIAYYIHLNKWKWAETEGFTLDQIIGDMGDEVFERIELSSVAERLCI